jgi:hypothetical protein
LSESKEKKEEEENNRFGVEKNTLGFRLVRIFNLVLVQNQVRLNILLEMEGLDTLFRTLEK